MCLYALMLCKMSANFIIILKILAIKFQLLDMMLQHCQNVKYFIFNMLYLTQQVLT